MKKAFSVVMALFLALFIAVPLAAFAGISTLAAFAVMAFINIGTLLFVRVPFGSLAESLGPLNASNPTTFTLDYVPSFVLVDATDADLVVDSITLTVGGRTYQEITDQNVIQAISKLLMKGLLGADVKVAQILKLATGEVRNIGDGQKCKLILGNAGITTPTVYAFSSAEGSMANIITIGQDSINARGNAILSASFLLFEDTNFSKADILYLNGHKESDLSLVEIAAMLAMDQATDADGKLATVNVIDLAANGIAEVKLYAGAGGALPYYLVNIPGY